MKGFKTKLGFKNFIKNNVTKVILAVMVLLFAISGIFGLGSLKVPTSSVFTGESSSLGYMDGAVFSADFSSDEIKGFTPKSVWISFGSLDHNVENGGQVYVRVGFSESQYSSFSEAISLTNGSIINTVEKIKPNSWQYLATCPSTISSVPTGKVFFVIATKHAVRINEVAFVGEDLNKNLCVLPLQAEGSGIKGSGNSATEWKQSLSSMPESFKNNKAKSIAEKLIDEQGSFNPNRIDGKNYKANLSSIITEKEYFTLEGVRNFKTGSNIYADKTIGVFSTFVLSIGTSIFGYNSVGIRIMPFLFSIANLFIVYALGKTLFKNTKRALLFVFLFIVGGFALGLATTGSADAIGLCFALLAFNFMFRFYKKSINPLSPFKSLVNVLFSGIFFALALTSVARLVFLLPALLFVFVFTLVKWRKEALKSENDEIKSDASRITLLSVMLAFLGFVFIPFILIAIFVIAKFSFFSVHYGSSNLLVLIVKVLTSGITSVNPTLYPANHYLSFGWLINYGAESMGVYKAVFGNIVLTIVNILALVFVAVIILKPKFKHKTFTKEFKSNFIIPILTLSIAVLGTILGGLVGKNSGITAFYPASVMLSAITVFAVGRLKLNDKTQKNTGTKVAGKKVATAIVLALMLISALLSIGTLAGFSSFPALSGFNVLNGALI